MRESTKTKGSCKMILQQGDTVVLLEKGISLYLVELLDAADPSKRTWVPASYLLPVHAKKHGNTNTLYHLFYFKLIFFLYMLLYVLHVLNLPNVM